MLIIVVRGRSTFRCECIVRKANSYDKKAKINCLYKISFRCFLFSQNMEKKPVIIPADRLSPQALQGVIEEFITREGTDYGMREVALDSKVGSVKRQLDAGLAVIVFDPETETTTIVPANDPVLKKLAGGGAASGEG